MDTHPRDNTDPLVCHDAVQYPENITLTIELDTQDTEKATSLRFLLAYENDHGTPAITFQLPFDLSEEDFEALYSMAHHVAVNRARIYTPDLTVPERVPVAITDHDIPKPLRAPLMLQERARRKVLDNREEESRYRDRARFIGAVDVHRADCLKIVRKWREADIYTRTLDREADWDELLPAVSEGKLVPVMCLTCKPVGTYSHAVNARTEMATFVTVPEGMPDEIHGFTSSAENYLRKQAIIKMLTIMDEFRWRALADFIRWASEQVED